MLTNAMRILAGQVPHRDFYAVYGPADYYLPAALFKLFGESVLASRLLDLFIEALTVVSVYAITSVYCRRAVCLCAATVTLLWFYGLEGEIGGTVFPVALLSLVSSAILIPLFAGKVSKLQLGMAGTIAGLSALYRYDTGVAILGVQISVIAIACYLSADKGPLRATNFASTLWPYLLGFGILTVPPAIYFFSVSPAYPLLLDVVILQARYYHRGRNLPFPRIHLAYLEQLAVYLPIFAVGLAVSFMAVRIYRKHRGAANKLQPSSTELQWRGLLVTLGLLAFVMFFKGFIRVGIVPMFVSLLPSLVIAAGFFDRRMTFSRPVRGFITALASFFVLVSILSAHAEAVHQWKERSVPGRIMRTLFFPNRPSPGIQATWCKLSNPITRGFCFLTDQGRVDTINFLTAHTTPGEPIFVGLRQHDKVFANDNLIYFGAQRLPATRWSGFDPGVQSSLPVQREMVAELDRNAPPYIVLDSEFENFNEPNDSSRSSGVTLLDDYIRRKYRQVERFDEMTIWQRVP